MRKHLRSMKPAGRVFAVASLMLFLLPSTAFAAGQNNQTINDPASYVDPFVGTGSGGNVVGQVDTFPGADMPFGMLQWSPDTPSRPDGGGYNYDDTSTQGFSLTHISGPGCPAFGDVPILPTVGDIGNAPGSTTESFSHKSESASPGYYGVTLGSAGIKSELTVTDRTGIGQFTFPATKQANMLFKVADSANGQSAANIIIDGPNEISGSVTSGHFCGAPSTYKVYFTAVFSQPFTSYGTWNGSTVSPGNVKTTFHGKAISPKHEKAKTALGAKHVPGTVSHKNKIRVESKGPQPRTQLATSSGAHTGGWVTFDTTNNHVVTMKVAISFVSVANAKLNLQTEDPRWNFNAVKAKATATWNHLLGKIQVTGGTGTDRTKFYTALYHSLLHPNLFSDVNGQYIGFDNKVHTAPKGHAQYANYSGWDIYRSQVPLMSMLAPQQTSDMMQSLVNDQQQGGWLPKWGFANDYTGVMNGDAADAILAEAYTFGVRGFDVQGALKAMIKGATDTTSAPGQGFYVERPDLANYMKDGYVPGNGSETLEYAIADFSIAQFAKELGDTSTFSTFMKRAQNWENLFNPAVGWLEARNGVFFPTGPAFDVNSNGFGQSGWEEGNAIQYTWMVPQNLGGLFNAMGGNSAAISKLDKFFTQLNVGPNKPYMWAGNEPSLDVPWEYNYAGAPYKTQAIVRKLMNDVYAATPGGEPGNDDLGATSSWFVWSALGMYPETPGTPVLTLASPLFSKTIIHLNHGRQIVIHAPQASDNNAYIQNLKVNGKTTEQTWISFNSTQKGTTRLDYTLGSTPNKSWGTAAADASPSFGQGEAPVLGFTPGSVAAIPAGQSGSIQFSVRNVSSDKQSVHWSATAPSQLNLSQSSGDISLGGSATQAKTVDVSVPKDTPTGIYLVPISLQATSSDGTTQSAPTVYVEVAVAKPGSLITYFNNDGISSDSNPGQNTFDGEGWSYSLEALKAAGVTPGHPVSYNGIAFDWPNSSLLVPNNVISAGQSVDISGSGNTLGFIGASANGPAYGTGTIHYTDGTTQDFTLGLSDWTLNGSSSTASYDNAVVAKMPYRDTGNSSTGKDNTTTYLFYAGVSLIPGKTVKSVTLPNDVNQGTMHVFSMSIGNATNPNLGNPHPTNSSVSAAFNNAGISDDSNPKAGNFDGGGWSYSSEALQAAGFTDGKSVTVNGVNFQWPGAKPGLDDNIQAAGQRILLNGQGGALAFLGAATGGPAAGQGEIDYSDGTVQKFDLGLSDWTLNAGSSSPAYNNVVAAKLPYRNSSGGKDNTTTYVFYSAVSLMPNKTVQSVTLPLSASRGSLHIFAMSIGNPTDSSAGNITYTSLAKAFNNTGISDDSNPGKANFDGGGWSYSAEALKAAGLTPGGTVTSNGVTYQWPSAASGSADNVVPAGETIALSGSGKTLGFLGAASDGTAQGTGLVTYTDGTQQSFTLGFTDWASSSPQDGNTVLATMSYRNNPSDSGGHDSTKVNVYSDEVQLDSGKTVASVTLPTSSKSGTLHVFSISIGQ